MHQGPLEKHIQGTYFSLRVGLTVLAFALPLLLWVGGKLYADLPLQSSMSAYYHAGTDGRSVRDVFVGIVVAVGVCLYLYKGYSNRENVALNIAGFMAIGIAMFPMAWNGGQSGRSLSIHGTCAVSFFLSIAFVCIFCSGDTLSEIDDKEVQARYQRIYWILAALMVASPLLAFLFRQNRVFWIEVFGIYAFGGYWWAKGTELFRTGAEKKALRGELEGLERKG